ESAAVAFHPAGGQIAVWGKTLGVWDIAQRQFVWQHGSPHSDLDKDVVRPYRLVTWSPNGELVAAVPADEATVEFWRLPSGEQLIPIGIVVEEMNQKSNDKALSYLTFTPDSTQVACGCADGSVRIYDCQTGAWKQTLRG